jgi:hypothetical protein
MPYIAGLWKSQVIDDLTWEGRLHGMDHKIPLDEYRSPGWSWISVLDRVPNSRVGSILYNGPENNDLDVSGEQRNVARYATHSVQLANATSHFGRVSGGSITLNAKMVRADSPEEGLDKSLLRRYCNYTLTEDDERRLEVLLIKQGTRPAKDFGVVLAADYEYGRYGSGVLIVLPGQDGTWRRVGGFWEWPSRGRRRVGVHAVNWSRVPYREVTLI